MKLPVRSSKPHTVLAALLFCLVPTFQVMSQEDTTKAEERVSRVTLKDGSQLIGNITGRTVDTLGFRTASGISMGIAKKDIVETETLSGVVENGVYKRVDPNRSRLFLSPTARPLKGGEGYIQDVMVFFPYIAVGIADYFSVGGGMTLFPGAPSQLYYLAPKISVPVGGENVHLAGGLFYTNITSGDFEGGGMAFGMITAGSPYSSFTLGVGKGFVAGSFAETAILIVGGEAQISNSVALISENWFPTGSETQLISLGVRFFGEHLSADLGFIHVLYRGSSTEGFPVIPWIGFSYHFGK